MTRFMWGTVTAVGPLRVRLDGDSAELPFSPDTLTTVLFGDRVRCEITDRRVIVHGGTGDRATLPAGSITQTARLTAPDGWLLCQGQAVSRTTYASLFAAIGTAYGAGDGSTTFNVPDLRGRVPVGLDSTQTQFDTLGEAGGAKTHTLSVAEMPSHTHVQDPHNHANPVAVTYGGNASTYRSIFATNSPFWSMADWNNPTTTQTATNQYTGGGGAHNNLQPYRVLNFQIKT